MVIFDGKSSFTNVTNISDIDKLSLFVHGYRQWSNTEYRCNISLTVAHKTDLLWLRLMTMSTTIGPEQPEGTEPNPVLAEDIIFEFFQFKEGRPLKVIATEKEFLTKYNILPLTEINLMNLSTTQLLFNGLFAAEKRKVVSIDSF